MAMSQQPDTRPPTPAQGAVLTECSGGPGMAKARHRNRAREAVEKPYTRSITFLLPA